MNPFYWALGAALIWGCVPLIEKFGLMKIDPYTGLIYRCLGVAVGLIVLPLWKTEAIQWPFPEKSLGMICLMMGGFLASVVGQIFFYNALKTGEASRVVPLAGAYPLVSFILGVILLGEKLTLAKLGGIGFVLMGVFLLK